MLPALGETSWRAAAVVVDRERSVAGDVLCKNGHMDFDWRKRASMLVKCAACMVFGLCCTCADKLE
jgi:hypothetical protein